MKNIKDELQNIILGDEQAGSGSQLKKAQNFLRGYEKASISVEKQQRFKDEETTALIAFAKRGNLFYDNSIPVNDFISEGAEQKVYRFDDTHVLKTNQSIFYESWLSEVIFKFSTTINFDDKHYEEFESEDISSNDFHLKYILSDSFEKRYYDFLLSLDIARMGAFHHGIGLMFINQKFTKKLTNLSFPSTEVLAYSLEKKWPVFESLDILKTWNWYLTKTSPLGVDELSSNNLSRAINALSHLYNSNSSEIESLFWSMVGIEALYVKGKEGISEQVRKKAQVFLGEIKEFKNRLTKMYDYRSGFVHGDRNFPSFFHVHDGLESYSKYINEYSDALSIAQTLLIATIQKMAKLDLSELNFKYVLE